MTLEMPLINSVAGVALYFFMAVLPGAAPMRVEPAQYCQAPIAGATVYRVEPPTVPPELQRIEPNETRH